MHQERDTDPDQQPETNPYFFHPLSLDQRSQRPPVQDQRSQRPPSQDQRSQPPFSQGQPPNQWPQQPPPKKGKKSKQGGQEQRQPSRPRQQEQQSPGSADHFPLRPVMPPSQSKPNQQHLNSQDPSSPQLVPSTLPPSNQRTQNLQPQQQGSSSPPIEWRTNRQHQDQFRQTRQHRHPTNKPLTWFLAVFCAILWVVIIVGGLIVLIVYLVYRPRLPRFDISAATLNAAYLDMGYLLNADITMLANFSNPNRKVNVDFSYMYIDLYYGSTLIATQYVPPFYAIRAQSKFAYIHMVTSQVGIPLVAARRLKKQIEADGVQFQVKGYFRARSTLGRLLKYSYLLHTHCNILMSGPPTGALIRSECKTKH